MIISRRKSHRRHEEIHPNEEIPTTEHGHGGHTLVSDPACQSWPSWWTGLEVEDRLPLLLESAVAVVCGSMCVLRKICQIVSRVMRLSLTQSRRDGHRLSSRVNYGNLRSGTASGIREDT